MSRALTSSERPPHCGKLDLAGALAELGLDIGQCEGCVDARSRSWIIASGRAEGHGAQAGILSRAPDLASCSRCTEEPVASNRVIPSLAGSAIRQVTSPIGRTSRPLLGRCDQDQIADELAAASEVAGRDDVRNLGDPLAQLDLRDREALGGAMEVDAAVSSPQRPDAVEHIALQGRSEPLCSANVPVSPTPRVPGANGCRVPETARAPSPASSQGWRASPARWPGCRNEALAAADACPSSAELG